ncbi:FecCD family ABC transporter permease [Haliangium sp.]|uniref:FecCD family ABC transporter permease n=1 Tax=Haliangium sp. TaxID=2663208 RepID=UPI003D128C11
MKPRALEPLAARRFVAWVLGLSILLGACMVLAVSVGAGQVSLLDVLDWRGALDPVDATIFYQVRLPRVLLAALLGGALATAGAVFQAILRNPLADPYVLGVSGGASIGGVLALLAGVGAAGMLGRLGVSACAFASALAALFLVERVATVQGRLTVYTMLLTGAVFNAFSGAVIYFIQSVASLEELHAVVFYLMGSVPSLGYPSIIVLAVLSALALLALLGMARDYNVLSLGEASATQLGVDVEHIKRRTFLVGSLLTGLAVAAAGLIGFVGLVVPHLLRLILGPDHRLLVPASFLGGAAFLVLADLLARWMLAPGELPVGVITALIGGPFFLTLMRRNRGRAPVEVV